MNQFGLEGGSTCAATCPKSVEEAVEGDGVCEPATLNFRHYLLHHLHESNAMVVTPTPPWESGPPPDRWNPPQAAPP